MPRGRACAFQRQSAWKMKRKRAGNGFRSEQIIVDGSGRESLAAGDQSVTIADDGQLVAVPGAESDANKAFLAQSSRPPASSRQHGSTGPTHSSPRGTMIRDSGDGDQYGPARHGARDRARGRPFARWRASCSKGSASSGNTSPGWRAVRSASSSSGRGSSAPIAFRRDRLAGRRSARPRRADRRDRHAFLGRPQARDHPG